MSIHVSIKKIEISINGLSDKTAKRSFAEFDKELSAQASLFLKGDRNFVHDSSRIDGGKLNVHSNIRPAHLRRLVAQRILTSMVRESL